MDALRLEGVGKRYGDRWAVEGLTLAVPPGGLYGLLGPNGAGKTTTIRMAMGILVPDAGSLQVLGGSPSGPLRNRLGYLPEERGLYETMRIGELLVFLSRLKGVGTAEARRRAAAGLEELALGDSWKRKLNELSKGNQQKVQFLATILHEPELVFLDEPFSGLDPVNAQVLVEMLLRIHRSGRTVILSSHRMDQVERLCQSIALISQGRLVLEGDLRRIKHERGTNTIAIQFEEDIPAPEGWPGVRSARREETRLLLAPEPGADTNAILRRALESGRVARFEWLEPSLEEIFVSAVGRTIEEEERIEARRREERGKEAARV